MSANKDFYDRLYAYCEGCLELRLIKGGRVHQHFFELEDYDSISECCDHYKNWNVYFGVGTRDASGKGAKENVVNIPALWCDVDFKDIEPNEVKKRLDKFPYKPTAAILTGHGVHFYWFIDEPAGCDEFDRVEDILGRICDHFDGDSSACEIARVLRVPGSVNVKSNPKPVKIHSLLAFIYDLENFDILPPAKTVHKSSKLKSCNPPGWMIEAFNGVPESGNDHFRGRDAAAIKLAGFWIERLSFNDVFRLLQCWNIRNTPPLTDNDLNRIVKSASRYVNGVRKNENEDNRFNFPVRKSESGYQQASSIG